MTIEQIRSRLNARRQELLGMKVLVLAGGASSERDVSLNSGRSVAAALAGSGYSASLAIISEQGIALDYIRAIGPAAESTSAMERVEGEKSISRLGSHDMVVTMMHGSLGENGTWQGLLKLVGVPFVSADVKGSAVAMDKSLTKFIASSLGIDTPAWWTAGDPAALRKLVPANVDKLVVKPVEQGSSVGVAIIANDDPGWEQAGETCSGLGRLMAEVHVEGRELTSGWIGNMQSAVGLPIVEIRPQKGFYDYQAKYTKGASNYICPAEIPAGTSEAIIRDAGRIYRELELFPLARIDFIMDGQGRHWFLEANTLPGFTELSLLPMAAAAVGVSYSELLEMLMLLALERSELEVSGA